VRTPAFLQLQLLPGIAPTFASTTHMNEEGGWHAARRGWTHAWEKNEGREFDAVHESCCIPNNFQLETCCITFHCIYTNADGNHILDDSAESANDFFHCFCPSFRLIEQLSNLDCDEVEISE
jgi:hypothetical protein